jgi:hypothetical protein
MSAGAGGIYLYNLEQVPVSGRRRFNIIPAQLEEMLGSSTVEEVRQQYAGRILPDSDVRVRQVKKVLARLLPYAEGEGLQGLDWEVTVIESPEQNAFVAPGGKVFVFTGILPLCRDEDGIAAVLGHEIAHVVAHHTAFVLPFSSFLVHTLAGALTNYDTDVWKKTVNACPKHPLSCSASSPSPSLTFPSTQVNCSLTSFFPCLPRANTRQRPITLAS